MTTAADIVALVHTRRWPLASEKALQAKLADELAHAGIPAEREVDLGDGDIIDFMIGGIGLELKLKGQRRAIFRQCERYCGHDRVVTLVLATNAAMGLPATIAGKPVHVASLSRGWL